MALLSLFNGIVIPAEQASAGAAQGQFATQQEFFDYLKSIGVRTTTVDGSKSASMATYNLYGLIVYGQPFGEWGKNRTGTSPCVVGQAYQRYLGYDAKNNAVTNSCFPNDADAGGSLTTRTWVPIGDGSSWNGLSSSQTNQLLYKPLTGNGITEDDKFTVSSVGGMAYAQVLARPTLCASGSVKMNHRQEDGKLWYATFSVPAFGCTGLITTTITTDNVGTSEYTIPAGQDSITIPVKVTARVQYSGYFNSSDYVDKVFATYLDNGQSHYEQHQDQSVLVTSLTVYRSDFKSGSTSITKTLQGKGTLAAFGETPSTKASKTRCRSMKSIGIVRMIDELGRVVLPIELRRVIFGLP